MLEVKGKNRTIVFGHNDVTMCSRVNEDSHGEMVLLHGTVADNGGEPNASEEEIESRKALARLRFENTESLGKFIHELTLVRHDMLMEKLLELLEEASEN